MKEYDVLILGAGPAGLSAGIYLGRAKQRVLILDQGMAGGQVVLTHAVANYPGVGEVSGYQLVNTMRKQAESFGCTIATNVSVSNFDFKGAVKKLSAGNKDYEAKAVIMAVGGDPRSLGLESEQRLRGKGISYCATCDGDFFTNQEIVVVGGGNSALEEAVSLTKYASKVTIIHQFDHFQAYPHAVAEARQNPKIHFLMESEVADFVGEESLQAVRIRSKKDGSTRELQATGAFIFIGYVPRTSPFTKCVQLSPAGEIIVDDTMATSVPGVYAAGDARKKRFRQITTAVSDGTIAALSVMEHLSVWQKEE